jgi:beta-barrel assembly-enhancing protease
MSNTFSHTKRFCAATLALLLGLQSVLAAAQNTPVVTNLPDLGEESATVLSPRDERRLGETAVQQLRAQGAVLNDPEVNAYLNDLATRLRAANPEIKQSFEVFGVNDPAINAFALPGGFIGLNLGIIVLAQSESELASVMAHEMAHVTQSHIARSIAGQQRTGWVTLAALALAILAARSNPQVAQAAAVTSQAVSIQSQLDYTREFEREADRIGFQTLERSKLDPNAMSQMFERLQRASRANDNTLVPNYLRTHPVTFERIADAQSRAATVTYRQPRENDDFHYVRALVRSYIGDRRDTIAYFEDQLRERKFNHEAATRYGLVAALLQNKDFAAAKRELVALEAKEPAHPMVEALAGHVLLDSGDIAGALKRYGTALAKFPAHKQLYVDYPEALLQKGDAKSAATFMEATLARFPNDATLYEIAARANAKLGHKLQQHRYLGEAYARNGNLRGAIEQFSFASRASDGDFFQASVVEARLRDIRNELAEQNKERRFAKN